MKQKQDKVQLAGDVDIEALIREGEVKHKKLLEQAKNQID